MKKTLLLSIIIFYSSILLMAQKPIKLFKETKQLSDGAFQVIEKNKEGDTLILGILSSINPDIRNGEFKFYSSGRVLEARGYYSGDVPFGIWQYFDKQGNIIKEVNYNKTLEFLNSDTVKIEFEYLMGDSMPKFQNKIYDSFKSYVKENLVYPIYALKTNISDRVFLKFVVNEKGKVCRISILQSSGDLDLNMEALRLLSESPLWKPGIIKNVAVSMTYSQPITFEIK